MPTSVDSLVAILLRTHQVQSLVLDISFQLVDAKSQLQTTITSEAEYYALSQAMRALLPIPSLLFEMLQHIQIPEPMKQSANNLQTYVHEDNNPWYPSCEKC